MHQVPLDRQLLSSQLNANAECPEAVGGTLFADGRVALFSGEAIMQMRSRRRDFRKHGVISPKTSTIYEYTRCK